jgi:nucleoside 2-deoxyribosyltransferase
LVSDLIDGGASAEEAYATVFEKDVRAIEACDAVVINLDGRSVDEGSAFELGFAYARGKVCVGIRTDVRVLLKWGLNPMIVVPLLRVFRDSGELGIWASEFATENNELRSVA